MSVSVIGGNATSASGSLPKFAFTIANNRAVLKQSFASGIYVFTVPSGTYNVAFYATNGDLVKQASYPTTATTLAFTLPSAAAKLIVSASANGSVTVDYTPEATTIASQLVTTTQSVTLTKAAKVFLIGGGAAGSFGPGGSSGYFAQGSVAAGTYTATVGSAGIGNSGQAGSASTFGGLTAAGGTVSAGGSGGGAPGNNTGTSGGGGGFNGSNGGSTVEGAGGTGSGVELHGFLPGPGGAGGSAGSGGGTYAGGGGGRPANAGNGAYGYGGGGGGGGNGGASGSSGAILIIEDF
jgi:hypothetical protein